MTVGEMYQRMGSSEIICWMEYDKYRNELQEQAREDARHAANAENLSRRARGRTP